MEEQIVLVDKNNNVIGSAPNLEVRAKNLLHRGSDVFILNSRGDFLVTRRAKTKRVLPGLLQVGVGGAMRPGETYEETAKRELFEETGIKDVELKFVFSYYYKDSFTHVFPHTFECVYDGEITIPKDEVEEYFWMPLPELKEMIKKQPEEFTEQDVFLFNKYL
jgi:isopentenyldiphosphate isomerase